MKKLLLLSLMLSSFGAHAIQNTFHFDVKSSGPDIFACNAGIKHAPHRYRSRTDVGDSHTRTNRRGEVKKDMAFAKYVWIDQFKFKTYPGGVVKKMATGGWKYNTLFFGLTNRKFVIPYDAHTNGYNKARALKKLKFKLTSEKYGASYFVDICYYGPKKFRHRGKPGDGKPGCRGGQCDKKNDEKGYGGNWTRTLSSADLTITNFKYRDYIKKSGLKVKGKMICTKKHGSPKVVASTYPKWQSVTSGSYKLLWKKVNLGKNPPKKCVARYYFKETSEKRRGHLKHGARARVRLEVTDP